MLSQNKWMNYHIFDFLDNKSLVSFLAINKQFHQMDDYFKHRLARLYDLQLAMTKPDSKTYRQWWQLIITNKISLQKPDQILKFAIPNDFQLLLEYSLKYKPNLNQALVQAGELGKMCVTKRLIEAGADAKFMYSSALRKAARAGHFEVSQYLVESGANLHEFGDETLKAALLSGNSDLVSYFISQGSVMTLEMVEL